MLVVPLGQLKIHLHSHCYDSNRFGGMLYCMQGLGIAYRAPVAERGTDLDADLKALGLMSGTGTPAEGLIHRSFKAVIELIQLGVGLHGCIHQAITTGHRAIQNLKEGHLFSTPTDQF
jgi:hypothetical protein